MDKVSRSKVTEAIAAKGLNNKCAACNAVGSWIVPTDLSQPDALEVMMMVSPRDIQTGFAFAPMICGNCGFTQFLHLETLMKPSE